MVTGSKYYATGSLYADWLDVLGRDGDGELLTALVRADDPGVNLVDDWRGFGQRTTASGSARYDRARADRGDVFPAVERFSYQSHFYQIAMLSVLTGITRAALRDGSAALTARKRNYPQGLTEVPSDDAQRWLLRFEAGHGSGVGYPSFTCSKTSDSALRGNADGARGRRARAVRCRSGRFVSADAGACERTRCLQPDRRDRLHPPSTQLTQRAALSSA